jgi:hypothetical protein
MRLEPECIDDVLSLAVRVSAELESVNTDHLEHADKRAILLIEGAMYAVIRGLVSQGALTPLFRYEVHMARLLSNEKLAAKALQELKVSLGS